MTANTQYKASFYYRFPTTSNFVGDAVVGLRTTTGTVLASTTATISGAQTTWKQVTLTLEPETTPSSTENVFTITFDGAGAAGQTVNFAMLSLFPPTFKDRPNGMRVDLAEVS